MCSKSVPRGSKKDPPPLGDMAETSLSNRGYGILKRSVSGAVIDALKKHSVVAPVVNPMMAGNKAVAKFPVYLESRAKLYIPKCLGLTHYGVPTVDKTTEGYPMESKFKGSLRDTQRAPVEAFMQAANDPKRRGGVINMACAAGKTVMALYIAAAIGRKTLVVVHKTFLSDQWIERIEQFLPDARVGRVQGTTFDVDDKDIVICMLQTLSIKTFTEDAFQGFGLVIVDECHHTSAEVFSRALHKVNFRYSLGLSATVQRKDGLSFVFHWFLGDIAYKTSRPREKVEVHIRKFQDESPKYCQELFMFGTRVNMARMITNICDFEKRTQYVASLVNECLEDRPGSKILVLSERRNHLIAIKRALEATDSPPSTGFYVGGLKQEHLKESEGKTVILGTFAMASEGMDIPALDTLILASPKSDIEQPVGRILRVRATERARVPRVVDLVDDFSVFRAQAAKRLRYYKRCGYHISHSF